MADSDDHHDLEDGKQEHGGPGSTDGTGGESHGEDLGMHLEHHAEEDTEERREPASGRGENRRDDPVPFDKESRLSDVAPERGAMDTGQTFRALGSALPAELLPLVQALNVVLHGTTAR